MKKDRKPPPAPVDLKITSTINGLEAGGYHLFPGANRVSVSAIASRIGKAMGRQFVVRRIGEGVQVWRVDQEPQKAAE